MKPSFIIFSLCTLQTSFVLCCIYSHLSSLAYLFKSLDGILPELLSSSTVVWHSIAAQSLEQLTGLVY